MLESAKLLATLAPIDYSKRADKVREFLPEDIDALLITHLTNVRYITGFTGSNACLYLTRDSATFITDGRYIVQSNEQLTQSKVEAEIIITSQGDGPLDALSKKIDPKTRIGLESTTISLSSANTYMERFEENEFVPTVGVVESARLIKEAGEVDRIRAACRIADDALSSVKEYLKELPTEKEFARVLDRKMVDLGADGNSFDTITACGVRGALPHAVPSDSQIKANQMIVIDFGCIVDGYCSDMTRTLSVGEPDARQQEMYEKVMESQRLGREVVKAGVDIAEIDAACRNYLLQSNLEQYFTHSTGHGVGLDIHEQPWVRAKSDEKACSGHILTVEPGIYIEGVAGVRIEDTLCVTDDGSEVLTTHPKDLVV